MNILRRSRIREAGWPATEASGARKHEHDGEVAGQDPAHSVLNTVILMDHYNLKRYFICIKIEADEK